MIMTTTKSTSPGERLYLEDDETLGIHASSSGVRERHIARYEKAIDLAGVEGGVWLDVACGSGYGTQMIAEFADWAYGVDSDETALTYAQRHHAFEGDEIMLYARLEAWQAPDWVASLEGSIDVVISIETLEHLEKENQLRMIHAVCDNIADDGVFVLACPIGDGGPNPDNPWHLHEPTEEELSGLLGKYFDDVQIDTEEYESTSGPAVQAWAVCRHPKHDAY